MDAHDLIRSARQSAGLTQTQLALQAGMTQPAIARLERPGANPRISTVERVLRAAGRRLDLAQEASNIDATLVARQLRMTPAQRLAGFVATYADMRELARAAALSRGELA